MEEDFIKGGLLYTNSNIEPLAEQIRASGKCDRCGGSGMVDDGHGRYEDCICIDDHLEPFDHGMHEAIEKLLQRTKEAS